MKTPEEASDNNATKLMELLGTKQLRNCVFSNPDLQEAFSRVSEIDASPSSIWETGQRTGHFVAQVARIADKPLPNTLREARDLLYELSREVAPASQLIGDILSHEWLAGRFQSDVIALSGELKPEIQTLAEWWLQIWWLYLFRLRVATTYGNDFTSAMMDHVHQRFRKLGELLDPDHSGLSGVIDYWVTGLDDSIITFKDLPLGEGKIPGELLAGCSSLKTPRAHIMGSPRSRTRLTLKWR